MADIKKKTLSLSLPAGVKRNADNSGEGKVRQSFSHGKSKVVTVEVKRKRAFAASSGSAGKGIDIANKGNLTKEEFDARIKAVQYALKEEKELEEKRKIEAEVKAKEEELARLAELKRAEEKVKAEEVAATESTVVTEKQVEQEVVKESKKPKIQLQKLSKRPLKIQTNFRANKAQVSEESSTKSAENFSENISSSKVDFNHSKKSYNSSNKRFVDFSDDEDIEIEKGPSKKSITVKKDIKELRGKYSANSGRVSIYNAFEENSRTRSLSSIRRARQKNKSSEPHPETRISKEVILPETISIQELASRMAVRTGEVMKALMKLGVMATANQVIDADTAEILAMDFGNTVKRVSDSDIEIGLKIEDSPEDLVVRPPVVTIMGHVDHGKTSLLDALRKTDIVLTEAGGITQGIGAYQVTVSDGRKITFVDTPGHAAFTEMRSRGANVTDIVVLVVAADDGVKEQTIESINHIKAANVPVIVAINKIDKPGADPEKVRNELLNYNIIVEKFGGDVMDVEISAKKNINLSGLEKTILLQAEMLELKANPNRSAEGTVIESRVEKGQGAVATVLINKGTLRVGNIFVSGSVFGRVRAIKNDLKQNLKELTPGTPGEIIGFNGSTLPGDDFVVVQDESKAREIANYRDRKKREQAYVVTSKKTAEQLFTKMEEDEKLSILSVIIKADVQGSSEAICVSLGKLATEEVAVKVIHSGIGEITESDVALARASNALIIGFNVRANAQARDQISRDKIQVRYYSIIYDLIDDVKKLMSGLLAPEVKEKVLGSAEVRKTFDVSKLGRIAGCMVLEGIVKRNAKVRLIRNGVVVYTSEIKTLKRLKDDVKEVREGFECGMCVENYNDIHVGDILECFEMEEISRQL